jgi:hypothetical protein
MSPLVYLVLGIPGSGRRAILRDLVEDGLPAGAGILVFMPEGEAGGGPGLPEGVETVPWRLDGATARHGRIASPADRIFFLAPGGADPADTVEAVAQWLRHNDCRLARILTVVNCGFLKENPEAAAWHDACIHFSDAVLLARRETAGNRWVRDYEKRFRKDRYPCVFELAKKGRVENPARVLEPEARRLSLHFDELEPLADDGMEEAPEDLREDPYLKRLESGQRARPVPDIRKLL